MPKLDGSLGDTRGGHFDGRTHAPNIKETPRASMLHMKENGSGRGHTAEIKFNEKKTTQFKRS